MKDMTQSTPKQRREYVPPVLNETELQSVHMICSSDMSVTEVYIEDVFSDLW